MAWHLVGAKPLPEIEAMLESRAGILLIGPLGTNLCEILIEVSYIFIQENAFENVVKPWSR